MWMLPKTLEILNISFNQIKKLSQEVTSQLTLVTTLDISNNGMESLQGLEHLKRLRRLISKNNFISDLSPIEEISTLIEIDMENN